MVASQTSGPRTPLWRQLQVAADVMDAVQRGHSGTSALEAVPADLRPGVQALAFTGWRNWGRARALRSRLAPKKPAAPVDALLCLALALVWQAEGSAYDAHTLVDQAVEAAKRQKDIARQAPFVNACLRRYLRESVALVAATDADPEAFWNHPVWWVEQLRRDYPGTWETHLRANNGAAPMSLRPNRRQGTAEAYATALRESQQDCRLLEDGAIILSHPVPVHRLPGFSAGRVSVQDAAAQLAAPLLLQGWEDCANPRILDACAAPGGKTGHLLEIGLGRVVALEIDARRAGRIRENLQRLQLDAEVVVADAAQPASWWDGRLFDGILLDAPCSASGIVRRHPDIRWLRRASDIGQLAALQKALLNAMWPLVRPGGRLVYCTCSVFHAEGRDQIQTFLANNTDAQLLPSPGHLEPGLASRVASLPDNQWRDQDGFYYALLSKALA